jgi:hypothetical protein
MILPTHGGGGSKSLDGAEIAGIVVAFLVLLAVGAGGIFLAWQKKNRDTQARKDALYRPILSLGEDSDMENTRI